MQEFDWVVLGCFVMLFSLYVLLFQNLILSQRNHQKVVYPSNVGFVKRHVRGCNSIYLFWSAPLLGTWLPGTV